MPRSRSSSLEDISIDDQCLILKALLRHQPVGVNRHFEMICIQEYVNNEIASSSSARGDISGTSSDRALTCRQIWDFLNSVYDFDELEALESAQRPVDNWQVDFKLPFNEFGQHFKNRCNKLSLLDCKEEFVANSEDSATNADDLLGMAKRLRRTSRCKVEAVGTEIFTPAMGSVENVEEKLANPGGVDIVKSSRRASESKSDAVISSQLSTPATGNIANSNASGGRDMVYDMVKRSRRASKSVIVTRSRFLPARRSLDAKDTVKKYSYADGLGIVKRLRKRASEYKSKAIRSQLSTPAKRSVVASSNDPMKAVRDSFKRSMRAIERKVTAVGSQFSMPALKNRK